MGGSGLASSSAMILFCRRLALGARAEAGADRVAAVIVFGFALTTSRCWQQSVRGRAPETRSLTAQSCRPSFQCPFL